MSEMTTTTPRCMGCLYLGQRRDSDFGPIYHACTASDGRSLGIARDRVPAHGSYRSVGRYLPPGVAPKWCPLRKP